MEKTIKKLSYLNLFLAVMIVLLGLIQLYLEAETITYRKIRAVLGYFFIVPMVFISFVAIIYLLNCYFKNKLQFPLKYIYYNIPTIIILLYILFAIIYIFVITLI